MQDLRDKIDRAFVSRIGVALHDDTIVGAIIALAHSLHLRVLAEGVETESQAQFLRERGCYVAQGYMYSKPIDAEQLAELLDRQAKPERPLENEPARSAAPYGQL